MKLQRKRTARTHATDSSLGNHFLLCLARAREDDAKAVPDRYGIIFGALMVLTALLAAHPLRPSAAAAFEARLATAWQTMAEMPFPCEDLQPRCTAEMAIP